MCSGTGKIERAPVKVHGVGVLLGPGQRVCPMCGGGGAVDKTGTVRCGLCLGHGCITVPHEPAETKVLPVGTKEADADGLQVLERAAVVMLALGYRSYCAGDLARSDACREIAASLQKVVAFERGARLRSEPNPPDLTFGPR